MTASAYLIVIVGLAAIFAAGVFVGARLEYSNPRVATFAYRIGLLAGYAAGMTAVGWVLYEVVIPQADRLAAVIGEKAMFFLVIGFGGAIGAWGYWSLYKYNQRQRSGRLLEPREP